MDFETPSKTPWIEKCMVSDDVTKRGPLSIRPFSLLLWSNYFNCTVSSLMNTVRFGGGGSINYLVASSGCLLFTFLLKRTAVACLFHWRRSWWKFARCRLIGVSQSCHKNHTSRTPFRINVYYVARFVGLTWAADKSRVCVCTCVCVCGVSIRGFRPKFTAIQLRRVCLTN